jgi:CubicO group peptidase (beta-lactamase class C family)
MRTAILLTVIGAAMAAESWSDLGPYTQAYITNKTFPGAQLAVVSSGNKIRYTGVFGTLTYPGDLFNETVSPDTIYDIASCSKVVAATSCTMKLYEQGLLGLDDLWIKYVPEGNNNGKD